MWDYIFGQTSQQNPAGGDQQPQQQPQQQPPQQQQTTPAGIPASQDDPVAAQFYQQHTQPQQPAQQQPQQPQQPPPAPPQQATESDLREEIAQLRRALAMITQELVGDEEDEAEPDELLSLLEEEGDEEVELPEPPDPLDREAQKRYVQQLREQIKRLHARQNERLKKLVQTLHERERMRLAALEQARAQQQALARIYQEALQSGLDESSAREFIDWLMRPRQSMRDAVELFRLWKQAQSQQQMQRPAPQTPPPPPPTGGAPSQQSISPEDALIQAMVALENQKTL